MPTRRQISPHFDSQESPNSFDYPKWAGNLKFPLDPVFCSTLNFVEDIPGHLRNNRVKLSSCEPSLNLVVDPVGRPAELWISNRGLRQYPFFSRYTMATACAVLPPLAILIATLFWRILTSLLWCMDKRIMKGTADDFTPWPAKLATVRILCSALFRVF